MAREYIIVNDTPGQRPRFMTSAGGTVEEGATFEESQAKHFQKRIDARFALQLWYGRSLNREGWRIVTAPFFIG